MTINASTPWRSTGTVPYATWVAVIANAGGPDALRSQVAYDAARDLSALCLAMLGQESRYGTAFNRNVAGNHNPLNLRPADGNGYLRFGTWADGIRAWYQRVDDPAYKQGIYAGTRSIADLIHVYAPSSDNNNESEYVADVVQRLTLWAATKEESVSDVTFGRVPKPPIVPLVCSKVGPGHGYYEMGHPRQNVGICEHITDGYGSIEFYHDFFSIGGEREADALVDFVVGRDGRIGMLNDPFGSRAGYANGDTSGLEGDGPAFMAHFAGELDPPNFHLISIEHEGKAADDWTGPQWNASVALDAWLFDRLGVRYDSFPRNQTTWIAAHYFHSEFTGKGDNALDECPGRYIKQHIDQFQAEVKAVMMAHQVTATQTDTPKVPSVPWKPTDVGVQDLHGTKCIAFLGDATARRNVPIRSAADSTAPTIATVKQGEHVTLRGTVRTKKGRWAFVDLGSKGVGRAPLSAFTGPWPVL